MSAPIAQAAVERLPHPRIAIQAEEAVGSKIDHPAVLDLNGSIRSDGVGDQFLHVHAGLLANDAFEGSGEAFLSEGGDDRLQRCGHRWRLAIRASECANVSRIGWGGVAA